MNDLGTLSPVNVRKVWKNEPRDFTPWLADNADLLGKALGLELVHEQTEAEVGGYRADLVFRDEHTDRLVVVENMLDPTDHDHLGKLITYAAGLGAQCAVLISPAYRDEHRTALTWLNSISAQDFAFFGVVLESWRIGDSLPAPHFRVEVKPDRWRREVTATRGLSERQLAYRRFWSEFLPAFDETHPDWRIRTSPVNVASMGFASGRTGFTFKAAFCLLDGVYRLRAELYIDLGNRETNKDEFNRLRRDRQEVEQVVGESLEWDPLDNSQASRISLYCKDPIEVSEYERWPAAREWLIDAMGRMRKAFAGKLDAA